jgi:hypothetical protein
MKIWWKSKTFWVNVIAVGAIILRSEYGLILTPLGEVALLSTINLVLRAVTKEQVVWKLG